MNKLIVLLIVVLTLSSCGIFRKNRIIVSHTQTTHTEYRDTIVPVTLPRIEAYQEVTLSKDSNDQYLPDTLVVRTPFATAIGTYNQGKLSVRVVQQDTVIPVLVENGIRETTTTEVTEQKTIEELPKVTWFYVYMGKILLGIMILIILVVGIYLYIKIKPF